MRNSKIHSLFLGASLTAVATFAGNAGAESAPISVGGFTVRHAVVLPGSPETIFDAATGDISGWWDHSFSDAPARFYIEAKPGGGFFEIFNASGDGVRHATVTMAERGKGLRYEGPLGLAGNAITMVTTYSFEPAGADSTRFSVSVHAAGEIHEGWEQAVDATWHHFLVERFQPYIEAGKHLSR